ncbi:hypothetical protein Tco_0280888 [Tanacetum coccineum]
MSILSLRPCMCASAALLVCNYRVLGESRYGVSVPTLTKDHEGNKIQYAISRKDQYAVFKLYGNQIFWKISNVVPTPRNPRYAMFDWETATYGKIYDDIDLFKDFEADFPAIVHNDSLASDPEVSYEPTLISVNNLKSYTGNDIDEVNLKLPSEDISIKLLDSVINVNVDTYSQAFDKTIEINHDTLVWMIGSLPLRECQLRTMPPRQLRQRAVERLVANRVAEAIAKYKRNQANPGGAGENAGGAGSGNAGGNIAPEVRGCLYKTFLNCKTHSFNGAEGVVVLSCWFDKLESVFEISKCIDKDKVKYVVCTLEGRALTWWNGNVHTLGIDATN